jgi:hypothetical protein
MKRVAGICAAVAIVLVTAGPAHAQETTRVIEGEHLRIVSTADWDRAARLAAGERLLWTLEISASAPDPGRIDIGVRADGALPLLLDAALCSVGWEGDECPGERTLLREGWAVPRDGATEWLGELGSDDVGHLQLAVSRRDEAPSEATTDVAVHVRGAADDVIVEDGPEEEPPLTPTGSALVGASVVLAVVLIAAGALTMSARSRRDGGAR